MTVVKNGKAVKTFANRTDYLNENKAYELLRGTGLAPQLLYSYDGCIERSLVEGPLLSDLIRDPAADAPELLRLFGLFCDWYNAFRGKTGLTLGKVRFESFVLSSGKLVCTDFDDCRTGFVEKDLASAVSQLCLVPQPFRAQGMSAAKLFMLSASEKIKYDPEALSRRRQRRYPENPRDQEITALQPVRAERARAVFFFFSLFTATLPCLCVYTGAGTIRGPAGRKKATA